MVKKYKVMEYVLSSGIWDAFSPVPVRDVILGEDSGLEADLAAWQARYDEQFMRFPHRFDWDEFNAEGAHLTRRIEARLPRDAEIHYEPSDDREFFTPEECSEEGCTPPGRRAVVALRERKRTLLHLGFSALKGRTESFG